MRLLIFSFFPFSPMKEEDVPLLKNGELFRQRGNFLASSSPFRGGKSSPFSPCFPTHTPAWIRIHASFHTTRATGMDPARIRCWMSYIPLYSGYLPFSTEEDFFPQKGEVFGLDSELSSKKRNLSSTFPLFRRRKGR